MHIEHWTIIIPAIALTWISGYLFGRSTRKGYRRG